MSDAPERIWAGNLRPLLPKSELCIGEFVTYETGADGWNKYIRADLANWQPIEKYDAMKKKPNAVFYFTADSNGSYELHETVKPSRYFGRRVCTHFLVLPDMQRDKS